MLSNAFLSRDRVLDAATISLVNRMTTRPANGRVLLIDDLIKRLKGAGVWDKLDVFYVFAAHDEQAARLNWKGNASYDCTNVGTGATFTADLGVTGLGGAHWTTGWIPASHGSNYTLNDALHGVYLNSGTDNATDNFSQFGVFDSDNGSGTAVSSFIITRSGAGTLRSRLNSNTSQNTSGTVTTRWGLSIVQRTSSTAHEGFKNGASVGTFSQASNVLPNDAFYVGVTNNDGVADLVRSDRIAAAMAGGSLTSAQHTALDTALRGRYLTVIGAQ